MRYRVDAMNLRDGVLVIEGWCIPSRSDMIVYTVERVGGGSMPCTAVARDRVDVAQQFGADRMSGFTVALPFDRDDDAYLVMTDGKVRRRVRVNKRIIEKRNSVKARRTEKLLALVHFETLVVSFDFIRENGFKAFTKKAIHKIRKIDEDYDYAEWEQKTKLSQEETQSQKSAWQAFDFPGGKPPLISIVVPAYNTPGTYLRMLLDSVIAQTYPHFELIIADGSDEGSTLVRDTFAEYADRDARLSLIDLGGNGGISANLNAGLRSAKGDYLALCDHDDELPEWALYEVAKAISKNPKAQFIYTDEDKIDFDGRALFEPHMKSDMNMELLCSVNYICHLSVVRRDLYEKVGGFREEFDGAQDHDFFFRCLEEATREERELLPRLYKDGVEEALEILSPEAFTALREGRFVSETVVHVPKICYHWRYHRGSTASDPRAKLYAFEAGARAVKAHYERMGTTFSDVEKGVTYGYYHTSFPVPADDAPLVSIIIPNKDHTDDLDKCLRSVTERSAYRNIEFIIVENNSAQEETFAYYERITKESTLPLRVVRWEDVFNYSAINNFGSRFANGDILLFLNNDTELLSECALTEMVNHSMRPDVGAVGARLTYGDDTIQHAGVIVGLGGIAGAAFVGLHEKENSYMHRMMCAQELTAVTAACLMMRKDVFEAAGGFREELAVAFNDIDLCMKVRALGLKVIYDPYSVWHHYESKSRGLEDTPEKVERFNREIAIFAHYWGGILEHGDPYYNPNLTLRKSNFALRDLSKEKPGEPYALELDPEKKLSEVLREKERRGL